MASNASFCATSSSSRNSTSTCRGLHRADRRDRRRQVHPDRRRATGHRCARADAGTGARRRRRAEVSAEFDSPPPGTPWLEAAGLTAADTLLLRRTIDQPGQEPRLDQRQPGHRSPDAPARRAADRHPRPARLAKPDPADAVRGLLDAYAGATPRAVPALAANGARPTRPAWTPAAPRTRCSANANAGLADRRTGQARARSRRVGRTEYRPRPAVQRPGAARCGPAAR
jgi:hypothetical protein